jgi:hypothetical protein
MAERAIVAFGHIEFLFNSAGAAIPAQPQSVGVCELQWSSIEFETGTVHVRPAEGRRRRIAGAARAEAAISLALCVRPGASHRGTIALTECGHCRSTTYARRHSRPR